MDLKDAVAVITGGGSGLGEATAHEFAAGGARIVILDLPNSPGPKVAESLGERGLFVAADVVSAATRYSPVPAATRCDLFRASKSLTAWTNRCLSATLLVATRRSRARKICYLSVT
jgi:NAD(P)-dependent dehydrogenase (short-subunit alcohol dehydrogenase family)